MNAKNEETRDMQQIAIIGGGTIGISWAAYFLSRGLEVTLWDPNPQARETFNSRVADDLAVLGAKPDEAMIASSQDEAVAQADLVVECAPEVVALKRELLRELQEAAPKHAVIASSTSSLTHTDIAGAVAVPGRVVVAHPFNPPHLVPLVELYGPDPEVVARLAAFYRRIGKAPVVMQKEMVGHIANRLSSALWREALYLLQEGVASAEDIDLAVTAGPGRRWAIQGPFLTYHLGGGRGGIRHYLEHLGPSQQYRWASLGEPVMDERLKQSVIAGVESATRGQAMDALFEQRDRQLMAMQQGLDESVHQGIDASPCLLMVAPNGARRGHADHPAIPLTPDALARDARECLAAGASAIHLHVRDGEGRHLLDASAYREALKAIREAVGDELVLQVTSEAGGRYAPEAQRRVIAELQPEAVSLAVRELFGEPEEQAASGELCHAQAATGCSIQYILYSPEDLETFNALRQAGVIPDVPSLLLFVLGRYETPPIADPACLPGFLTHLDARDRWAVCAFGPTEGECMALAARKGGHARVGFENNLWRPDGELAASNAELVRLARTRIEAEGRRVMTPAEARRFLELNREALS
ncbi:MAG: 3-keto-5-aminohexanoate cleavage protein [Halomonas sp.]|nr:3-keto-5-aminohexanoate cleavage protein [Halomonas sp.]